MATPVYEAFIAGTDRAASHVLLEGFSLREVTNGIDTLVCHVESEDASLRPVKRQPVVVTEDGTPIFGGFIRGARESAFGGLGADGFDHIVTEIECDHFSQYFTRRFLTFTFAGGTLKDFAIAFTAFFSAAPFSVTLDGAQVTGPTLPAIVFEVERGDECLNFVAALTAKAGSPYQWKMDDAKVWGFYQAGATPAPWDVTEATFVATESTSGDIVAEPTDDTYANKIWVVFGNGKVVTTTDSFTGNGTATTFGPLKYKLTGPIPGSNIGAIGYAYVDETPPGPPAGRGPLGSIGTANMVWEYDPATNTIEKVIGPAPGVGVVITVMYDGQVKGVTSASDAGEIAANGLWEDKIVDDTIEDPVLALEVAEAELARRLIQAKVVTFQTRRIPGPRPGQSITVTVPKRNLTGLFTVVDVTAEYEEGSDVLLRTVTLTSSVYEHWRQTLTRWWSPNLGGGPGLVPAGSGGAGPAPPLYSVQSNRPLGAFFGEGYVLYYELFWTSPAHNGLNFPENPGVFDDPRRLEMGNIQGDFSMDGFGPGVRTVLHPSSILMNSQGNIFLTAGTGPGAPEDSWGGVLLEGGNSLTDSYNEVGGFFVAGGFAPGFQVIPGDYGDSVSMFQGLNVFASLAFKYHYIDGIVANFPFTIDTDGVSDTQDFTAYIASAGTGTITLPAVGTLGSPNYHVWPVTAVGRVIHVANVHASGVVTLSGGGATINDASSIDLGPYSAVTVLRFTDPSSGVGKWKVLASHGTLTGGGGGGTPLTIGGNDKDVQFNDGGVLGGEDAFEYDKTKDQLSLTRTANYSQLRILTSGSDRAIIAPYTFSDAAEITFGRETVSGTDTARTTAPGYFWFEGSGGSPPAEAIGFEINPGEVAGSAMSYALGRGFQVSPAGIGSLYQYGGLGTGSFTGCGLEIDRNDDGSGAAGYLSLQANDGTRYYLWVDAVGKLRISTAPPQEDGTPSDTSGTVVGTQT